MNFLEFNQAKRYYERENDFDRRFKKSKLKLFCWDINLSKSYLQLLNFSPPKNPSWMQRDFVLQFFFLRYVYTINLSRQQYLFSKQNTKETFLVITYKNGNVTLLSDTVARRSSIRWKQHYEILIYFSLSYFAILFYFTIVYTYKFRFI